MDIKNRHIIDVFIILLFIGTFVIIPVRYSISVNYRTSDNYSDVKTVSAVNIVNLWLTDGSAHDDRVNNISTLA
ncbi:MAG: hypothetical protein QMD11_06260 [Smithella sp.]|nr:hypothetical protein [Smithella sp.]